MAADEIKAGLFTPTVSRDATERLENELRIEAAPGFVQPPDGGATEPVPAGRSALRKTPTARED